jgi:hypothetical protein
VPYCPKCRDEFQDWVKVCPDCNVALVEKLPPTPRKRKKQDEPLVHIATAPNEAVANIWSGILEEQGIPCLLQGGEVRPAMYVLPYQPYEIYVLASEVKKAKKILAPFLKADNRSSQKEF